MFPEKEEKPDPNIILREFLLKSNIDIQLSVQAVPVADGTMLVKPIMTVVYMPRT